MSLITTTNERFQCSLHVYESQLTSFGSRLQTNQSKKKGRKIFLLPTMTTKKNSLLFKIKLENEKQEFQVNDFIDFFWEGGLFESYLDEIFGIATYNFNLNIFNVTFKETTLKSLIEDLYETFKEPQQITIKDEIDCTVQINRPLDYRQLITLYSMPFDVNMEHLKAITNKLEILKNFEFGKHKKCLIIHNPYLHLYLENFNRKEIPD